MRRRPAVIVIGILALLALALAALPFWLGAAARAIGGPRGLTFSSYERIGYARFALSEAEYVRGNVRVRVSRVEAPTPLLWAWRQVRGTSNLLIADAWEVEVKPPSAPRPVSPERGWVTLQAQLHRVAGHLARWLPHARLGRGVVSFPGGEISAARGEWQDRTLNVSGLTYRALTADAVVAFAPAADEIRLRGKLADGTEVDVTGRQDDVRGRITWSEQPAQLEATFDPRGWLPRAARLTLANWTVPAERLRLAPAYAAVQGAAEIEWRDERLSATVRARGEPLGKAVPPITLDVRGEGDRQSFLIQQALQAELPGISARLDQPLRIKRTGEWEGEGATVTLAVDLARQPWFEAAGHVAGRATVTRGDGPVPRVGFNLSAREVAAKGVNVAAFTAEGVFQWPRVDVRGAELEAAGERLSVRGGWDIKAKELIDAVAQGAIHRSALAGWLPRQPEFERIEVDARAAGAWPDFRHEGRVATSQLRAGALQPVDLTLAWQGRGFGAEQFDVTAATSRSRLAAAGSASREAVQLTRLEFAREDVTRLALQAPAVLRWRPELAVENLQLAGGEAKLAVQGTWGPAGRIELAAANISSRWFADFLALPGPAWELRLLAMMGRWEGGPMAFSLSAGAALELGEGRIAVINTAARGDGDGVRIEALRATEGDAAVVNATGALPVTLHPGTPQLVRLEEQAGLELNATAAPNAAFWRNLAAVTGVELVEPRAAARIRGTWARPEGELSLRAARLAFDARKITRPLPAVEQIDVRVVADHAGVTLETFAFRVEGQPVRAQGRLPVGDGEWPRLLKEPLAVAQRGADLQLEVPPADVAVFARFLPPVLAPKGRIEARVAFKGGELSGRVRLEDAASKPLGPLGVLQEISADLALAGRTVELRQVAARSGGQPVTLTGRVELPAGGEPRFDLALRGENLPFVRQTGLLLRGDLDLKLQSPAAGPPRLGGVVRLRDSLFLADVRAFLPKGGAGPTRRPPYFSVDTPPVNGWQLAVEVSGEKFMRLRTPVFAGVASARFRLGGTLGEPRALGEIEIEEGTVRMPFARFEVQQGSVRLTEAEPYEPSIYLRGAGRRYGYDLTMEIDGRASAPNVVFTSSPALESEQVLLMVMTGAAPANEITVTGTQRVTRLGTFVGQNLLSSFTSDGADADRLSITSGEKVSRLGKETYEIEYKLGERWTLSGEYNEFDEYNAGVKWRWLRGEPPPAPEVQGAK